LLDGGADPGDPDRVRGHTAIVIFVIAALAANAVAQPDPTPPPSSEATRLFEEGRELAKQGKFEEACDRFGKSLALDPAPGTKLNLGDCLEHQGQVRKAWLMFEEAARDWDRLKDSRVKFARDRAAAASNKLATLVVKIAEPKLEGLAIKLGDRAVQPDAEVIERMDAGAITITASASGRDPFEKQVALKPGRTTVVDVVLHTPGSLKDPIVDPPPPPPGDGVTTTRRNRKRVILAYSVGGVGGILIGAGIVVGLAARNDWQAARNMYCNGTDQCPDQMSRDKVQAEVDKVDRGTYLAIPGIVLAAGGVALWVTAPSETVHVTPTATATSIGLAVGGQF
jgi:hypothetical protein